MSAHPTFSAPLQPTSPSLPRRGDIFDGKFRVDDVLGVDGNGAVLAATRLDRGDRVAIKVLLPEAVHDAELIARCTREGRASSRIRSENFARASEAGLFQGRPYLVLEYAAGSDGRALVDEGGIRTGGFPAPVRHAPPPPAQATAPQAQRPTQGSPTLWLVPTARAVLAQPAVYTQRASASDMTAVSVPPPPMRSALPGYALAAGALLAIAGVVGGAVWHQSRALRKAEARVDAPTLAPALNIPTIPKLGAATAPVATDQVTTTSAVLPRGEPTAPAAEAAQPAQPATPVAPIVAKPMAPAVAAAPPAHHRHHHAAPRGVGARASATTPVADDDNPYASASASTAAPVSPGDDSHLFEIRK